MASGAAAGTLLMPGFDAACGAPTGDASAGAGSNDSGEAPALPSFTGFALKTGLRAAGASGGQGTGLGAAAKVFKADAGSTEPQKQLITSISEDGIQTIDDGSAAKPKRVIPLKEAPWVAAATAAAATVNKRHFAESSTRLRPEDLNTLAPGAETALYGAVAAPNSLSMDTTSTDTMPTASLDTAATADSVDDAAVKRVLEMYGGGANSTEGRKTSGLVIPMQDNKEAEAVPSETERSAKRQRVDPHSDLRAALFGNQKAAKDAKAPQLLRVRMPGSENLKSDAERLEKDLEWRPEVDEAAFEEVPIEEFGEAMIRGMGGNPDTPSALYVPASGRGARAGLGSTVNPLRPAGGAAAAGGSNKAKFNKYPGLKPGVVVRMDYGRFAGKLGLVIQTDGVPGLERMRVRIGPDEFDETTVDKSRATIQPAASLTTEQRDFVKSLAEAEAAAHAEARRREKAAAAELAAKKKAEEEAAAAAAKAKADAERKAAAAEAAAAAAAGSSDHHSSKHDTRSTVKHWLMPNIRVRVVSNSLHKGRYYNRKAVVVEVSQPGRGSIKMESGTILDDVSEHQLETVIPKEPQSRVKIVHGPYKGQIGLFLQRGSGDTATVTLPDEGITESISMDWMSEYVGRGDYE